MLSRFVCKKCGNVYEEFEDSVSFPTCCDAPEYVKDNNTAQVFGCTKLYSGKHKMHDSILDKRKAYKHVTYYADKDRQDNAFHEAMKK